MFPTNLHFAAIRNMKATFRKRPNLRDCEDADGQPYSRNDARDTFMALTKDPAFIGTFADVPEPIDITLALYKYAKEVEGTRQTVINITVQSDGEPLAPGFSVFPNAEAFQNPAQLQTILTEGIRQAIHSERTQRSIHELVAMCNRSNDLENHLAGRLLKHGGPSDIQQAEEHFRNKKKDASST